MSTVCPACKGRGHVPETYPRPRTIERHGDLGWMAVSPEGYKYRIGVVGETEREACIKWYEAAARWEALGRRAEVQKALGGGW